MNLATEYNTRTKQALETIHAEMSLAAATFYTNHKIKEHITKQLDEAAYLGQFECTLELKDLFSNIHTFAGRFLTYREQCDIRNKMRQLAIDYLKSEGFLVHGNNPTFDVVVSWQPILENQKDIKQSTKFVSTDVTPWYTRLTNWLKT